MKAAYQDELTLGVEKALDPTLSVGLKGTYRTLGRTVEDRCDLDYNDPLSERLHLRPLQPGRGRPGRERRVPDLQRLGQPDRPERGRVLCDPGRPDGRAKRIFRGIEPMARKQFTNQLWAQASFLYSSLQGNYSGAIREATGQTDPASTPTSTTTSSLQRVRQSRARSSASGPHRRGVQRSVRPLGRRAVLRPQRPARSRAWMVQQLLPGQALPHGSRLRGRTPTDYDMNLSLGYNVNLGPVTVTPQLYVFNLLNRQTAPASPDSASTRTAAS